MLYLTAIDWDRFLIWMAASWVLLFAARIVYKRFKLKTNRVKRVTGIVVAREYHERIGSIPAWYTLEVEFTMPTPAANRVRMTTHDTLNAFDEVQARVGIPIDLYVVLEPEVRVYCRFPQPEMLQVKSRF